MSDNVIPFIKGEEEKSELEPMKLWGRVTSEGIVPAEAPLISAHCIRVPVSDGHLAAVSLGLTKSAPRGRRSSRAGGRSKGAPRS